MAQAAYGIVDRRYSEVQFESQINELAGYNVNAIQPPSAFNGPPVFHVSRGNPGATILFRIHAVPAAYVRGAATAMSVVNLNHQRGLVIAIQPDRDRRVNGIQVNALGMTFSHAGGNYRLIYEIVGIGNHEGDGYRLRLWNAPIFQGHFFGNNCIRL